MKNKQLLFNMVITLVGLVGGLYLWISLGTKITFVDWLEYVIPNTIFYGICRWIEFFIFKRQ